MNLMREFDPPKQDDPVQFALSAAGIGTWDVYLQENKVYVDNIGRTLLGFAADEPGDQLALLHKIHPLDQPRLLEAFNRALLVQADYTVDLLFRTANGKSWLRTKGRSFQDATGNACRFSGILSDVTTEMLASEKIHTAESLASLALEGSDTGSFSFDLHTGAFNFSPSLALMLTGEADLHATRDIFIEHVHPDDAVIREKAYAALVTTGHVSYEARFVWKNGAVHWVKIKGKHLYDLSGKAVSFSGIGQDISQEVAASKEQQKLLSLVEHSGDFIAVVNMDQAITYMNQAGLDLVGLKSLEEATGKQMLDLFAPDHLAEMEQQVLPAVINTGKWTGRQWFRHFNTGEHIPFEVDAFRLDSPMSGRPIALACVARDLREQLRSQSRIQEAQHTLENAVEIANLGTWQIYPQDNNRITMSDRMKNWMGYAPGDTLTIEDVLTAIPDKQKVEAALQKALQPGGPGLFDVDYHVINQQTGQLYVMHSKGQAFFTNNGEAYLLQGTTQDITLQRELEITLEAEVKERTEELAASNEELTASNEELAALNEEFSVMNEELQEANQNLVRSNQELEQYAYVASHDLQEPLRKIRIYSDMLNHQQGLTEQQTKLVTKIDLSAQRMSMLIKDLLEFSRLLETGSMIEQVDLNMVLQNVTGDFELVIEDRQARVILGELPVIEGVRLQMNQLFYNLLGNALKFVQQEVTPVVEVFARRVSAADLVALTGAAPGKSKFYYEISVKDNGIGFEQKYADQVFQVFKRLHASAAYPGSGIGLAMCKRIVLNHGGDLQIFSEPGKGTTLQILLPALAG
jgi:PAS domain S-box-containing protein